MSWNSSAGDGALHIVGGTLVNVFTGETYCADVLCRRGLIAEVMPAGSATAPGQASLDARGLYVLPGLINGHMHVESSMVTPAEYACTVLPHGTTCAVADPHEIANVLGAAGVRSLMSSARSAVCDFRFTAPSCVPATAMETAGASLGAAELEALLEDPAVVALGEMMNFPGVVRRDPGILAKIAAAGRVGKPVDGHAPGLTGTDLNAYVAAGVSSEHEATTLCEAREKMRLGMWLMVREGSAARNLAALLPLARDTGGERMMFVTDDRHPDDLLAAGELDEVLRLAVAGGLDPVAAVRMATLNPAAYFGLDDRGVVAPGRIADLWLVRDLAGFETEAVVKSGRLVYSGGRWVGEPEGIRAGVTAGAGGTGQANSVHLPQDLSGLLRVPPRSGRARVIGIVPGQIVTRNLALEVCLDGAGSLGPAGREVSKIAVIERHGRRGSVGVGLVSGLGLAGPGAIASTVAHDSHNLIVAGSSDREMIVAAEALGECGGGFAVVRDGVVSALLPLPYAGLMSRRPVADVARGIAAVNAAARELGCELESPMMALSFLALPVIPELKLTDLGLFDVAAFRHVPLWIG